MIALFLATALATAEPPTRNGDRIGTAEMQRDGRIVMRLRSVNCDGTVAEGKTEARPNQASYQMTIRWLGGLRRGQTKPVIARNLRPCERR